MVRDSRLARGGAGSASPPRMAIRLVTRRHSTVHRQGATRARTLLPVIGPDDVILPTFDETLGAFALRAKMGDREARDALYAAFLPKLQRQMNMIRVPFAPEGAEGIWNRDDLAQDGYLVFTELIDDWAGDITFTAYLLSRFQWRLRDAIRKGVGKPSAPPRQVVVPIERAVDLVDAGQVPGDVEVALAEVLDALDDPLGQVLIEHLVHGKSKAAIARDIGVSRRTMVRYWQEIRACAKRVLLTSGNGDKWKSTPVRSLGTML